jgi:hypothetical protein
MPRALRADLVAHREVAAAAFDDDLGSNVGPAAHVDARADGEVAAPAEGRLQRLQGRRDREGVDGGLYVEPRRRARVAGPPVDAAPAQGGTQGLRDARLHGDAQRAPGPEDAAADVARTQPGAHGRGDRADDELAHDAAPAGDLLAAGFGEATLGDQAHGAARAG